MHTRQAFCGYFLERSSGARSHEWNFDSFLDVIVLVCCYEEICYYTIDSLLQLLHV